MKEEGSTTPTPAGPPNTDESVQRTIQAAPGDVTSARPVTEPSDTTKR
jgi:sec-independent protein translocase protein TatA